MNASNATAGDSFGGKGAYDNLQIATTVNTVEQFKIAPRGLQAQCLIICGIVGVLLAIGVYWGLRSYVRDAFWRGAILAILIGADLLLCSIIATRYIFETRRGDWLVYDKPSGAVMLPRLGQAFPIDDVVGCECATNRRSQEPNINNPYLCELYLVTRQKHQQQRWLVLKAYGSVNALNYLVEPLTHQTPIHLIGSAASSESER